MSANFGGGEWLLKIMEDVRGQKADGNTKLKKAEAKSTFSI